MAGFLGSKTEGKKVKSPGWAALDRKMRGEELPESEGGDDPFPPVSDPLVHTLGLKCWSPSRSFSSVVCTSRDSGSLQHPMEVHDFRRGHAPKISDDVSDNEAMADDALSSIKRLKFIHGWADESLISDILAEVDNDEDKASSLLGIMVSPTFSSESANIKEENFPELITSSGNQSEYNSLEQMNSLKLISAPAEPEWEDKNVYLTHRKDAIRMMRSAANHSRAAANAYQRGDHHSARQLSRQAQEEQLAAEELNWKAAQEILIVHNSHNDLWKLDLHGLHASEAVKILNAHLLRIETHLSSKHPAAHADGLLAQFSPVWQQDPNATSLTCNHRHW